MQSMGRDELLVLMPADERLVRDILMYKRTEKYIRQNISITQQEAVKRILTDKGFQNRERYAELQQRVQSLMGKASYSWQVRHRNRFRGCADPGAARVP